MRGRRLWQVPLLSTKVVEGVEAAGQCFSKYHAGAFQGWRVSAQEKKKNPVPVVSQSQLKTLNKRQGVSCLPWAHTKLKCRDWGKPVVLVVLGVHQELKGPGAAAY